MSVFVTQFSLKCKWLIAFLHPKTQQIFMADISLDILCKEMKIVKISEVSRSTFPSIRFVYTPTISVGKLVC